MLESLMETIVFTTSRRTKKFTRVADRAFPDGKSPGRNRVISVVRPSMGLRLSAAISRLFVLVGRLHYNEAGGLNMTIETLLSGLSTSEKLDAMDILWRDLSNTAGGYISPEWHGRVLAERLANPSMGARLPLADSIRDVKERLDARRT